MWLDVMSSCLDLGALLCVPKFHLRLIWLLRVGGCVPYVHLFVSFWEIAVLAAFLS